MASVNRRLTSILATDCVGFSSLMEKDEEKTLENLKACRSIIDPYIEEYGGEFSIPPETLLLLNLRVPFPVSTLR